MQRLQLLLHALVGFALVLVFAPVASAQGDNALVRVVHASPDAPAVDVYVDGTAVIQGISYFTATDYLEVPAGEHQIQVTPAGEAASSAVIDTTANLAAGQAYTIAAAGPVASIQPVVLTDDLSAPAAGEGKFRAIHLAPEAPTVDVRGTLGDNVNLASGVSFGQASTFTGVTPGLYTLVALPSGSEDTTSIVESEVATLGDNTIYDFYILGQPGNIDFELVSYAPGGTIAAPAADLPAQQPTATEAAEATPTVDATADTETVTPETIGIPADATLTAIAAATTAEPAATTEVTATANTETVTPETVATDEATVATSEATAATSEATAATSEATAATSEATAATAATAAATSEATAATAATAPTTATAATAPTGAAAAATPTRVPPTTLPETAEGTPMQPIGLLVAFAVLAILAGGFMLIRQHR